MLVNCGFSADLSGPVADRAVFHADNAYFLEDVAITPTAARRTRRATPPSAASAGRRA
jgi:xanthine dehydrogenase molybdopterin-binding subunit B